MFGPATQDGTDMMERGRESWVLQRSGNEQATKLIW